MPTRTKYNISQLRAVQLRAEETEGQKKISCYFAVFDDVYEWAPGCTETIDSQAFSETLGDDIRALINHDTSLVLGRTSAGTLILSVDTRGLKGEIIINENDQDALNLYARVKRGDVNQCSIGFDIISEERTETADGKINWHITKIKLYEVSIVTFPAYEKTEAVVRSKRTNEMLSVWKKRMKERVENAKTVNSSKKT